MSAARTRQRHAYVPFFMDSWYGGTARMTRLVRSVYFDVCLYNWDKAEAVPASELTLMLADLEGQGERIIEALVKSGRLERKRDGAVFNKRAMDEAKKAFDLWKAKSKGGKKGRNSPKTKGKTLPTLLKESPQDSSTERERERERDSSVDKSTGAAAPSDPLKELFDVGVSLLVGAGKTDRAARSLLGKLRKERGDDSAVLAAILECRNKSVSDPAEWLTKRLEKPKYVSASGYEYQGTLEHMKKECQRRGDNDTYWKIVAAEKEAGKSG